MIRSCAFNSGNRRLPKRTGAAGHERDRQLQGDSSGRLRANSSTLRNGSARRSTSRSTTAGWRRENKFASNYRIPTDDRLIIAQTGALFRKSISISLRVLTIAGNAATVIRVLVSITSPESPTNT